MRSFLFMSYWGENFRLWSLSFIYCLNMAKINLFFRVSIAIIIIKNLQLLLGVILDIFNYYVLKLIYDLVLIKCSFRFKRWLRSLKNCFTGCIKFMLSRCSLNFRVSIVRVEVSYWISTSLLSFIRRYQRFLVRVRFTTPIINWLLFIAIHGLFRSFLCWVEWSLQVNLVWRQHRFFKVIIVIKQHSSWGTTI